MQNSCHRLDTCVGPEKKKGAGKKKESSLGVGYWGEMYIYIGDGFFPEYIYTQFYILVHE
jgi:hypothetical protein